MLFRIFAIGLWNMHRNQIRDLQMHYHTKVINYTLLFSLPLNLSILLMGKLNAKHNPTYHGLCIMKSTMQYIILFVKDYIDIMGKRWSTFFVKGSKSRREDAVVLFCFWEGVIWLIDSSTVSCSESIPQANGAQDQKRQGSPHFPKMDGRAEPFQFVPSQRQATLGNSLPCPAF